MCDLWCQQYSADRRNLFEQRQLRVLILVHGNNVLLNSSIEDSRLARFGVVAFVLTVCALICWPAQDRRHLCRARRWYGHFGIDAFCEMPFTLLSIAGVVASISWVIQLPLRQ